jgi:hypothetical protein
MLSDMFHNTCYDVLTHWFWQRTIIYLIWKWGSWLVWTVDKGCLLLLCRWVYLYPIFRTCISYGCMRLIIVYYIFTLESLPLPNNVLISGIGQMVANINVNCCLICGLNSEEYSGIGRCYIFSFDLIQTPDLIYEWYSNFKTSIYSSAWNTFYEAVLKIIRIRFKVCNMVFSLCKMLTKKQPKYLMQLLTTKELEN